MDHIRKKSQKTNNESLTNDIIVSIQTQQSINLNNRSEKLNQIFGSLQMIHFEEDHKGDDLQKEYENISRFINNLKHCNMNIQSLSTSQDLLLYAAFYHNISNCIMRYAGTLHKCKKTGINDSNIQDLISKQNDIKSSILGMSNYDIKDFTQKNSIQTLAQVVGQILKGHYCIEGITENFGTDIEVKCNPNVLHIIMQELCKNFEKYGTQGICEMQIDQGYFIINTRNQIKSDDDTEHYSTSQGKSIITTLCQKIGAEYISYKEDNTYHSIIKIPILQNI